MSDEYNEKNCDERHKFITKDIDGLKKQLWIFVVLALSNLIALVLLFVKEMVVK